MNDSITSRLSQQMIPCGHRGRKGSIQRLLLQTYLNRVIHLHTATNRVHWTEATRFRASTKPLLLLTVLDQFAQSNTASDLVELTPELGELFAGYWSRVMPPHCQGNIAMPFYRLLREAEFLGWPAHQ